MPPTLKEITKERILGLIRSGEWKPNDQVPSERALSEAFGVSRVTIREALQALDAQGVFRRVPGTGARIVASPTGIRSRELGLVVPDIRSNHFGAPVDSFFEYAAESGYEVSVRLYREAPERFEAYIEDLVEKGIAGIAVVIPRNCPNSSIALLERISCPIVLMSRGVEYLAAHQVVVDNERLGELATEHLLALGHTRIACLAVSDYPVGRERAHGYRKALRKRGVPFDPELVVELTSFPLSSDAGAKAIEDLLEREIDFTAVVGFNYRQSALALSALERAGKRVPEEVAVIGIDEPHDGLLPNLSTVVIDWKELGRVAGATLINEVERPGVTRPTIFWCRTSVVPRQSCGYIQTMGKKHA